MADQLVLQFQRSDIHSLLLHSDFYFHLLKLARELHRHPGDEQRRQHDAHVHPLLRHARHQVHHHAEHDPPLREGLVHHCRPHQSLRPVPERHLLGHHDDALHPRIHIQDKGRRRWRLLRDRRERRRQRARGVCPRGHREARARGRRADQRRHRVEAGNGAAEQAQHRQDDNDNVRNAGGNRRCFSEQSGNKSNGRVKCYVYFLLIAYI